MCSTPEAAAAPPQEALRARANATPLPIKNVGRASARTWYERYGLAIATADIVAIVTAVVVAYLWRYGYDLNASVAGSSLTYPSAVAIIGLLWWAMLDARGSRERGVIGHGLDEYRRVISASLYAFSGVAIASYFLNVELSRGFFLALLPLGLFLLLLGRWAARQVLHRRRAMGGAFTPTVVVGAAREVREVVRDLHRNRQAGYRPVAVALAPSTDAAEIMVSPVLADLPVISLDSLNRHVRERRVGAVVVAAGLPSARVRQLAWDLETCSARLMFVPALTDVAGPRLRVHHVQDLSLVSVDLPRFTGWNHALKRGFDVLFSAVALVVLAPALGVIALMIKREDGGPVFFLQERVGLSGEPFVIHKFRTMRLDAEERLASLRATADASSPLFKMEDDPRVTKVGSMLRASSLDELPQFWTALKGRMSVVGPRPHLARELDEYPEHGLRRLLIKPGITGLWQISGRSDLSFEDAVRLDLRYVENWSLVGDLTIILKTVRAVLRSEGAY